MKLWIFGPSEVDCLLWMCTMDNLEQLRNWEAACSGRDRPVIVVVGAGPAGCAAALGIGPACHIVVVERGEENKDKPCGDALISRAVRWMRPFGIDGAQLTSLGGKPFEAADIQTPDITLRCADAGGTGYVLRRATVDQELRNVVATFTTIFYRTNAIAIERETGNGWVVSIRSKDSTHCVRCDAVVLAAGSGSSLSTRLGIDGNPRTVTAITTYLQHCDLVSRPNFSFEAKGTAYDWVFPLLNGSNLGSCALDNVHAYNLRLRIERLKEVHGYTQRSRFRGGLLSLWSGAGQQWHSRDGLVSCGDAAGLVDPYSAEGISAALESGYHAGVASSKYALEKAPEFLEEYSAWVRESFNRKYADSQFFWSQVGVYKNGLP
jgi:flavin-dependent dehydrogenase